MKSSFTLIGLLAVAISLFVYYSFVQDPPSLIGEWGLRQMEIDWPFEWESECDTIMVENEGVEIEEDENEVDSLPQNILLIGDSMAGPFSYRLSDYATANGHTLTTVCWCSSATRHWANTETLQQYLDLVKPTYIFICLGANQLFYRDMTSMDRDIKKMKAKIGEIPCVWVGPPNWKPDTGINELIRTNMGSDGYYPSLKLTFQRISDGKHPTNASAAAWCDSVAVWITKGNSCHTILMNRPETRGKQKMYYLQPPTS